MGYWLKQENPVTIKLGPFVDSSDGFTPMTALSIGASDVRVAKHGLFFVAKSDATDPAHDENGWYSVTLDEVDTEDTGELIVAVNQAGALPVWREFLVVKEQTYGALVQGSSPLVVDAAQSVWDEVVADHTTAGTTGKTVGSLTFTVAGQVDANVQAVKDTAVTGSGTGGDPWGPT